MPPRTPRRRTATNLLPIASSFVGRTADIDALASRLDEGRLVTILGPGGMGKTRLALRFAEDQLETYVGHRGGGVWFCDLTEARGLTDVVTAVAAALRVELRGLDSDATVSDAVGHAIARRGRVLVVLDNFDRVAREAPGTVARWMRAAPSARFVVTSRVPLDLVGEHLWSLAPLSHDEAVELFVRRARQVQPALDATRDAQVVGEICDAIDCMPLAIELAATRMAILSTTQLRDRLRHSRELLAGRREVGRHASMHRTVLDSVDLLDRSQRALFAACATMRNGFTLEAAEAVLADTTTPRESVLQGLETLARNSLLRVNVEVTGGGARYAFFETIRDVADELLAAESSRDALLGRHASHYAAACVQLRRVADARGTADLAALARELENLLQAHHTAVTFAARDHAAGRASEAVAIALGLEPLLSARGLSRLRARLFDEALAALASVASHDSAALAEAHLARGLARRELGEAVGAREDFERALTLARSAQQPALAAVALMRLGGIRDLVGDTEGARARLDEALGLLRELPADGARAVREAEVYIRLGHAYRREGDLAKARAAIIEAVARYRQLGHDEGLASAMYELGIVEMFGGGHKQAFAHFDEGLRVAHRSHLRVMTGALETARGCLLQDLGRLDEARDHHAEAARVFREVGSRFREASALYYLATTYLERGNASEAESVLHLAIERLEGVGAARYEALTASAMACALAAMDQREAALEAIARAETAAARVPSEAALACNVRIHRMAIELRARSWRGAANVIAEAETLVAAHPNDDSRFALRALRAVVQGDPRAPDTLFVAAGGAAFTLPGASESVTLPERSPLRRILEHFAQRRIDAPGEVVTIDDVIRAGWPGEKIAAEAALNRAHVALAALRRMGLRGTLLHGNGGYALSQAVVVRIEIKRD